MDPITGLFVGLFEFSATIFEGATGELFAKIIITIVALFVTYFVKRVVADNAVYSFVKASHKEFAEKLAYPISKMITLLLILIYCFFILWLWDFNTLFDSLLIGAGVLGVVVGFAAKDIVGNVLGGVMIYFDRPFRMGDTIKIGETLGIVKDIGLRSTKIKTFDNRYVTVPNGKIDSEPIENFSRYPERRFEITVGVDYETDLDKARKSIRTALDTLTKEEKILEKAEPKIFASSFENSSVIFTIYYWINRKTIPQMFEIKGDVIFEIRKQFKKDKITIPFPQVTISNRKRR